MRTLQTSESVTSRVVGRRWVTRAEPQ